VFKNWITKGLFDDFVAVMPHHFDHCYLRSVLLAQTLRAHATASHHMIGPKRRAKGTLVAKRAVLHQTHHHRRFTAWALSHSQLHWPLVIVDAHIKTTCLGLRFDALKLHRCLDWFGSALDELRFSDSWPPHLSIIIITCSYSLCQEYSVI